MSGESGKGRPHGRVKWFSSEKGYGFVTDPDGVDRYFHVSDTLGAGLPCQGDKVEFDATERPRGPAAGKVRVVSRPATPPLKDGRVECPSCRHRVAPRLWRRRGLPRGILGLLYLPLACVGFPLFLHTEHLCPVCGRCLYVS